MFKLPWKDLFLELFRNTRYFGAFVMYSCLFHCVVVLYFLMQWKYSTLLSFRFSYHNSLHIPQIVFLPYAKTVAGSLAHVQNVGEETKINVRKTVSPAIKKDMQKKAKSTALVKENKSLEKTQKKQSILKSSHTIKKENCPQKKQTIKTDQKHSNTPETIYLGQNDKIIFQAYQNIQKQLENIWYLPVGLDEGVACTIRVVLNQQGMIQETQVVQSSSILSYDISARNAAMEIKYPRIFYGQECIITFG